MCRPFAQASLSFLTSFAPAALPAATLISCGESYGHGYFFPDPLWNPDGGQWFEDGIRDGAIRLVTVGRDFDIEFVDAAGTWSYRNDGATVILLSSSDDRMAIGAFHQNYADIFSFDLVARFVAWSSHKLGPLAPKAATYVAQCD